MPSLALFPHIIRELFTSHKLPREPEPSLLMDDPKQVAAYAEAGRIDGAMAAAYLFHSARISEVVRVRGPVLDLACGPATQLAQVAQLNPEIQFTGMDLSINMLSDAEKHINKLGLKNVRLRQSDITRFNDFEDHSFDAVISPMSLHHLPTLHHLDVCFAAINRVLKPDGSLYLADFGWFKSLKTLKYFVRKTAEHQSPLFSLDFDQSMRAAFLKEEFAALAAKHFPPEIQVVSTYKVPYLVIIKTIDQPLPKPLRRQLGALRRALKPRFRLDLNDLRTFFALVDCARPFFLARRPCRLPRP